MNAIITLNDSRQIRLILDKEAAPETVKNFAKLAAEGFYEGLCFHRVIDKFMIQGGGFSIENGELKAKKAAAIKGEFIKNGFDNRLTHEAGVISMARTNEPNSASSQFFICVDSCSYLDGSYAAFGKVADAESLKVACDISKVRTGRWMAYDDVPVEPVIIKSVEVSE